MHFTKQKTLIGLLFILMPIFSVFAFLDTPVVSGLALEFMLKIARFRTGLRLETKSWTVKPFSFSAGLDEVQVGTDDFNLRASQVSVQLSPLGLIMGRFDLREIRIEAPTIYGRIPSRWLESDSGGSKLNFAQMDVPTWVGGQLSQVMEHLKKRNLNFDRLRIRNGKAETKELQISRMDLEISNLDGGQVRMEWVLEKLRLPQRLETIDRFEGSLGLLRERKNQFFLAVRRLAVEIENGSPSPRALSVSVNGRWPGDFSGQVEVQTERLVSWLKKSPLASDYAPKETMKGDVAVEVEGTIRKNTLEALIASVKTKAFLFDGYYPNDTELTLKKTGTGWEISNLKILLPRASESNPLGYATASKIDIENNAIKGSLVLTKAGLCAVLLAADAPECFVGIEINGEVPFEGTLEPLLIKGKPHLKGSRAEIISEPYIFGKKFSPLLALQAPVLTGEMFIEEKSIQLNQVILNWDDGSKLRTDGRIVYKPTQVDLVMSAQGANLESLMEHFMDLKIQGNARIDGKVFYSREIPREKGRTRILGSVSIDKWGISGQTFGNLGGTIEYSQRELKIGPLKLTNGGGKALFNGLLFETPKGSRLRLAGNFERLEVDAKFPESGQTMVHGFLSGAAALEGYTDFAKSPDTFFGGPIDVTIDTLTAFGIPFQSAAAHAIYARKILDIQQFTAKKGTGEVMMSGKLHPDAGTELRFSSTQVPVKNLGLSSNVNIFQDGSLQVEEGYWAPAKGWKVINKLQGLKIAGRTLTPGRVELSGDQDTFHVKVDINGQLHVEMETHSRGNVSELQKIEAKIENEGFYSLFAYLKKWNSENPVTAQGDLILSWTPEQGSLKTHGLEIAGPQGIDGQRAILFKVDQAREFAWNKGKVEKNDWNFGGPTRMALTGEPGATTAELSAEIPGALLDLIIPTFRIRDGRVKLESHIPLPPDLKSFVATMSTQEAVVSIPGIGQPITRLKADMEITEGRLNFKSLKGQLGSGLVSANGVYRLDLEKAGLFMDANLNRAQVILLDDILLDATGDISIRGEQAPYLLSGNVLVTNALYTKEFNEKSDLLGEITSDPALRFAMNVEIGSNSRVRNSAASAVASGKLTIGGTDQMPEMAGGIDILSGSVFAKDTEFRISQGKVVFPGGDTKIPVVNMLANTTVKQPSQDYRIQLQAKGPADQLTLDLTSDPALQPNDIVNLLAFGVIRSAATDNRDIDAARAEALQLLFGSFFGSNFSKATGVNVRFEASSDLAQAKTVPKVTAVRKLSDKVTATVGRSLDFNPETNVQVDYKLLRNVNLTGIWERKDQSASQNTGQEQNSTGVDLRFKFDLK